MAHLARRVDSLDGAVQIGDDQRMYRRHGTKHTARGAEHRTEHEGAIVGADVGQRADRISPEVEVLSEARIPRVDRLRLGRGNRLAKLIDHRDLS